MPEQFGNTKPFDTSPDAGPEEFGRIVRELQEEVQTLKNRIAAWDEYVLRQPSPDLETRLVGTQGAGTMTIPLPAFQGVIVSETASEIELYVAAGSVCYNPESGDVQEKHLEASTVTLAVGESVVHKHTWIDNEDGTASLVSVEQVTGPTGSFVPNATTTYFAIIDLKRPESEWIPEQKTNGYTLTLGPLATTTDPDEPGGSKTAIVPVTIGARKTNVALYCHEGGVPLFTDVVDFHGKEMEISPVFLQTIRPGSLFILCASRKPSGLPAPISIFGGKLVSTSGKVDATVVLAGIAVVHSEEPFPERTDDERLLNNSFWDGARAPRRRTTR
jgi:hypothetical protein